MGVGPHLLVAVRRREMAGGGLPACRVRGRRWGAHSGELRWPGRAEERPRSFREPRSSGFGGWWRAGRARSTARRGGAGGGHGGRGGVAVPAGTGPDGGVVGRGEHQRGRAVPARVAATGGHGERRRGETARRASVRRALAGRWRRQARPARERNRAEQHDALWQREEKWSTGEPSCDRRRGVPTLPMKQL